MDSEKPLLDRRPYFPVENVRDIAGGDVAQTQTLLVGCCHFIPLCENLDGHEPFGCVGDRESFCGYSVDLLYCGVRNSFSWMSSFRRFIALQLRFSAGQ